MKPSPDTEPGTLMSYGASGLFFGSHSTFAIFAPSGNGVPFRGMPARKASIAMELPTMTFITSSVWSLAITAQSSYPLNSANASPPGTFSSYLSSAGPSACPRTASTSIADAIVRSVLAFMFGISFRRCRWHRSLRRGITVRRQEWGEHGQQLLRPFFSDPVPAVENDLALHVLSNQSHGVHDAFAERLASADGKHGQGQLALLALFVLRDGDVDRSVRRETAAQRIAAW